MRTAVTSHFHSFDSTRLFFRTWEPTEQSIQKKAIILIHRGHEHSGRLQQIVDGLNMSDTWAFAYDSRGHGMSPGPRGYAEDFSYLVKDLDTFVKLISTQYGILPENMSLVANSVGAVVATTWVHDYAPRIRSMVLAAPAFRVKLYVPFALQSLRLLNVVKKPAFISSYVKSKMLTHDLNEAKKYNEDPLITRDVAVNILLGLYDASTRVINDAGAITTPTLILSAGSDFVVKLSAQRKFFKALGANRKEMKVFPKFFHGVFYEKGKEQCFALARNFIQETLQRPLDRTALLSAHHIGYSKKVYDKLLLPANPIKAAFFGFQKVMMNFTGSLSQGMQVGLRTGFDSGLSLDYVYENRARGKTIFGRVIDFFYLNAVGWRGIRQRKIDLEKQIEAAIAQVGPSRKTIRILDVAGGAGRYLLDVAARNRDKNLQFLICDNVEGNLQKGRQTAQELMLENVTFARVDAFTGTGMPEFKPDIIVISGFFELFGDNDLIRKCIARVVLQSADDAVLIYTGQGYHPQQEMIARTLKNRDGQAWVMRLRSQAELDEIFRAHGFEKNDMAIDQFGIFSVSRATKKLPVAKTKASIAPEMTV